jgi:hypothetical protein
MLSVIYAECHFCWVLFMLSVPYKPSMLSVIKQNVVMPSVIKLSVVAPTKFNIVFDALYASENPGPSVTKLFEEQFFFIFIHCRWGQYKRTEQHTL